MTSTDERQHIFKRIEELLRSKELVLVAIDGYGGSGKTTLAKEIQSHFAGSAIITLDDFATDTMSGADRKRFVSQVLEPLSRNKAARYQRFDWSTKSLTDWIAVEPHGLIIIEGVSVAGEDFNSYYDLRIWIDCPIDLASQRMRERDRRLGRVEDENYFNVWEKEDGDYGRTEPWKRVDIVVKVAQ